MERMETNLTSVQKNMTTKFTNLERNMETKLGNLEKNMAKNNLVNVEVKMAQMKTDMDVKFETVNEVKGLKTVLVEAFDQVKDVLVKMEDKTQ